MRIVVNKGSELSRLTIKPSPNVLERDLVGDIVQQECGVCASVIHGCLYMVMQKGRVSAIDEHKLRLTDTSTNHTTEALLASSVPELETNLDAVHGNFLCYKKSTGSGCGVLGVEFVLSVSL